MVSDFEKESVLRTVSLLEVETANAFFEFFTAQLNEIVAGDKVLNDFLA